MRAWIWVPAVLIVFICVAYYVAIRITVSNLVKTYPCNEHGCDEMADGTLHYLPLCADHLAERKNHVT